MPINLQHEVEDDFPLTSVEVEGLWKQTLKTRAAADDDITIRCVDEKEMKALNKEYRGKNYPTNVLTFSYDTEHDIALCMPVAEREAVERQMTVRNYVALLVVHALLHATGMDHERSDQEAVDTEDLENEILGAVGFEPVSL